MSANGAAMHWLGTRGAELHRPECVLATRDGQLLVPDARGGVTVIGSATQHSVMPAMPDGVAPLHPNSIALCRDGSLLLAEMGEHRGGVWRLQASGAVEPWLESIEGQPLPPTNFVLVDADERVWITVSTRAIPRWSARRRGVGDGFLVCVDRRGARIVADGFGFTNEVRIGPRGDELIVVETFDRRLTKFTINADGSLGARSLLCEFGPGVWPDGIAYDVEGRLLVASAFSNRLLEVDRKGRVRVLLDLGDPVFVDKLEGRFERGELIAPGPVEVPLSPLGNCTSVAYAGDALDRIVVGCLDGDRLAVLQAEVPGVPPAHWHFSFGRPSCS